MALCGVAIIIIRHFKVLVNSFDIVFIYVTFDIAIDYLIGIWYNNYNNIFCEKGIKTYAF